jgi:hypothetical protein
MVKFIFLLSRKPGLTDEQFREYYETKHAPLAVKLFPFFSDYRRNYFRRGELHDFVTPDVVEVNFDVVTEMTFESEEGYKRMVDAYADPAVAKQIADDEEKFIDRTKTRAIRVYEEVTPPLKAAGSGK